MRHPTTGPQTSTTPLRWLFVAVVALHALYALLAQRLEWPTAWVWLGPLLLQLGHAAASSRLYRNAGATVLGRTSAQLGVVLALSTLAASALAGVESAAATPYPASVWGVAALQVALGVAAQALWSGFDAEEPSRPTAAPEVHADASPPSDTAVVQALQQVLQDWGAHPPAWLGDTSTLLQPLQHELQSLTHALAAHNTATTPANNVGPHTETASHWQAMATQLADVLQHLRDQAHNPGLETLPQLLQHQQALQHVAQQQLKALDTLGSTLARLNTTLQHPATSGTPSHSQPHTELPPELQALLADSAQARMHLDIALTDLAHKLEANTLATRVAATTLGHKLDTSAQSTANISQKLHEAASASSVVAHKLNAVALADIQAASTLDALGRHASDGLGKLDHTLDLMQIVVQQLTGLDSALRAQSAQLTQVAQRIQDVKVVVESHNTTAPVTVTHAHLPHNEHAPATATPHPSARPHSEEHAAAGAPLPTRGWTVPTTSLSSATTRPIPAATPAPTGLDTPPATDAN